MMEILQILFKGFLSEQNFVGQPWIWFTLQAT